MVVVVVVTVAHVEKHTDAVVHVEDIQLVEDTQHVVVIAVVEADGDAVDQPSKTRDSTILDVSLFEL